MSISFVCRSYWIHVSITYTTRCFKFLIGWSGEYITFNVKYKRFLHIDNTSIQFKNVPSIQISKLRRIQNESFQYETSSFDVNDISKKPGFYTLSVFKCNDLYDSSWNQYMKLRTLSHHV